MMSKPPTAAPSIKIAVSAIVSLVMRYGDIDSRFRDTAAMHKGSAVHRKLQRAEGKDYDSEVTLRLETDMDGIPVILQGRADGIITDDSGAITIDEIKSTTLPLDVVFRQHEQHLAQAKCYAHMYLQTLQHPPDTIAVRLTYFQQESEEVRRHIFDYTPEEIAAFFADLLEKYSFWLRFQHDWAKLRDECIRHTDFPFPVYRRGQRELAVAAYRTIAAQKRLFASAPTGIGKTLSALFPSIKAMGEGLADKLFYLTAKTITRAVAEDAIRLMAEGGLRFKSITLRAKEKICPNAECICTPEACERAKGHYARINDALSDLLENNDIITADITAEYAAKHRVCPHEYELDASLWCDLIIGDYNHVFDPVVYLHRYFSAESKYEDKKYVFLIDEAHNLVDRVREMYSATLNKAAFGGIRSRLRGKDVLTRMLRKGLRDVADHFSDVQTQLTEQDRQNHVQAAQDAVFKDFVNIFAAAAGEWLAANKSNTDAIVGDILTLYFDAQKYLLISDMYDEHYCTITEARGKDTAISLFCLDPSKAAATMLARSKAAIIFSATLSPLPYYREILGGNTDDGLASLPSPFDPDRLLTIAHTGISTKFADRESSYKPIAEAIFAVVSHRAGNYFAFFPSYEYMRNVYELFTNLYPHIDTILQETEMPEEAREDFLLAFAADNTETLIGFVVLGGIFSEGIDLKGDRLIGAIITSVGIPRVSLRQELIMNYFDRKNGQGYDYAYTFPGINKVLQAAGRVIRTETDSGAVILIDSRYGWGKYRALLPRHWNNAQVVSNLAQLEQILGC